MGGGRQRSLDLDRFLDACDRVFEGQPCPPAPDASKLTDEFQMLTQGLVCNEAPSLAHALPAAKNILPCLPDLCMPKCMRDWLSSRCGVG